MARYASIIVKVKAKERRLINGKEISMLDKTDNSSEVVELSFLADLVGVPLDRLQAELFSEQADVKDTIPLSDLRKVVVKYLDATMLS